MLNLAQFIRDTQQQLHCIRILMAFSWMRNWRFRKRKSFNTVAANCEYFRCRFILDTRLPEYCTLEEIECVKHCGASALTGRSHGRRSADFNASEFVSYLQSWTCWQILVVVRCCCHCLSRRWYSRRPWIHNLAACYLNKDYTNSVQMCERCIAVGKGRGEQLSGS